MALTLLDKVIWPERPRSYADPEPLKAKSLRSFGIHRATPDKKDGRSGTLVSKKNERTIPYESQIEFKCLAMLEASARVKGYAVQALRIPVSKAQNYYPDIFIWTTDEHCVLCEVKPVKEMGFFEQWLKWKALRAHCNEHGYGMLITDGTIAIQDLRSHPVPPAMAEYFEQCFLDRGQIQWNDFHDLRNTHGVTWKDLTAYVYQHRLVMKREPRFSITRPV